MVFNAIMMILWGCLPFLVIFLKQELKCNKSDGYCFKKLYIGNKLIKEEKLCAISDISCAGVDWSPRCLFLFLKLKDGTVIPIWGSNNHKLLYDEAKRICDFLKNENEELVINWKKRGMWVVVLVPWILFILFFTSLIMRYSM